MEKKHEAILQMYGEKAEEAEELRLDIQDLKVMYRQQVRWSARRACVSFGDYEVVVLVFQAMYA